MAQTPHTASTTPSSDRSTGPQAGQAAGGAASRAFDEGGRQATERTRAAERVADTAAEAGSAATKAQAEILRTQIDTAQQAVRSGLEAGMRTLEGMTQNFTRAWGVASPNPALAEQSAQNVQAVAQASTALAKGAQDAARAWFDLTQRSLRTNLEAMGQLAGCRSVQEAVNMHSNLLRENLQQAIQSGEAIARASSEAIEEATRAMQAQVQRSPQAQQRGL